ncbi:MAG: putative phosphothreonine lyase domain-containing protein [Nanoarchaeota archaeon]
MVSFCPSFSPPTNWRENSNRNANWIKLRKSILIRDDYKCIYCNFRSEKYQIVHHIDGNPKNDNTSNLITICPMCNIIEHAGYGCVIQGVVDLYKESLFSQDKIIINTRIMRARKRSDEEIIALLGLKNKVGFFMDKDYLNNLYGFVTNRKPKDIWVEKALRHGYQQHILNIRQNNIDNRRPSQVNNEPWVCADPLYDIHEVTENCGKWMIFVPLDKLDLTWDIIKRETEAGRLGNGAKTATTWESPDAIDKNIKVIIVYTYDSTDIKDVARVAWRLYELGINGVVLNYKEDNVTSANKYAIKGDKRISKYSIHKTHFEKCKSEVEFLEFFQTKYKNN